jgi:hypothetical protein
MKNFEAYFTEMALTDFKKIGDWNNKKNRQGYDKQSLGILNSEAGVKKIQSAFNRIKDWDFNLYFLKKTNAWKSAEMGIVQPDFLEKIGLTVGKDIPEPSDDQITIVFTNNAAAERIPLTSWLIAHRIGHAFSATDRRAWKNTSEGFYKNISYYLKTILEDCYNISDRSNPNRAYIYSQTPELRNFLESIGKFRSARMKQLPRTGEFIYECFAQWLLTGDLQFNSPPQSVLNNNRKAWGTPVGRNYKLEDEMYADDLLDQLRYEMINLFDYWCNKHIGTISIM